MNQPTPPKSRRANPILWAWVACAVALGGACANGASGPSTGDFVPTQGSSSSSGGSQGGSSGSSSGPQQATPCTTCETDDGGTTPTGDEAGSGTSPTDDAGTTGAGDDASSPGTGSGDDAGGISIPPLSFPDSGLGGSPPASTDDGGANMCTTKICIDPVFDCPLQGCFNGCTDFHCN